jgi:hypothetical protein
MSPRLDRQLRKAAVRLDDPHEPMAETWRRVRQMAERLELPGPSYDSIRLVLREHRRNRAEVHALLEPVVSDFARGRVSSWDVARLIEAAEILRRSP